MNNKPDFSQRQPNNGADPLFIERWSPRAFQKAAVSDEALTRMVEAARWSPSCFNAQPWCIFTSTEATFNAFLALLVEGNQGWAQEAGVLGFIVSENNFEHNGKPNTYAQFDCGAAWMAMTLQARIEGLYTHGMGGIHADKAADYLKIDVESQSVVMGFAIGKLAELEQLSEAQQKAETPNSRKPLTDIWFQA